MSILKVPIGPADHVQGAEDAPLILVEYGDYECPYCKQAHGVIKQLQQKLGSKLKFVFRHFPLAEIHPHAQMAAETAEFAGKHGRFWEMHDLLYENQINLNRSLLLELADDLDLPVSHLEQDLNRQAYKEKIREDFIGGVRSGVNGTPTLFIHDHRYNGPVGLQELLDALKTVPAK